MPSGNGWQVTPTAINPASPAGLNNDFAINETFDASTRRSTARSTPTGRSRHERAEGHRLRRPWRGAQRRVEGWDRGCTLGAHGACTANGDTGLFPFANTNPSPYPGGFNSGALGIPAC